MNVYGVAAVVTGAASGLGEATARELARRGAKVAVFDRDANRGTEVAGEIGGVFCEVDVTSDEKVAAAFARARGTHGQERILVNCAGVANAAKTVARDKETKAAKFYPMQQFELAIQINLIGSFRCILANCIAPRFTTATAPTGSVERIPASAARPRRCGGFVRQRLFVGQDAGEQRPH